MEQDPAAAAAAKQACVTSLPEDIRAHPSLANFSNPADLAKSWVSVQPMIGAEKIPVPGKDSDPKMWDVVFDRLGRPKDPTAYSLPEVKFPEGLSVPDADLAEFKTVAHKSGLLPSQVASIYQ